MSWVLVFGYGLIGFVELNTYETFESCEAARQAATQAIAELEWAIKAGSKNVVHFCIPKPA